MAKKKQSAASNNGGATTRARTRKATASEASGNNKAASRGAARQPAMSNQAIGEAAGEVWQALSDNGPQTIAALKKSIQSSDELVLLGLGWLAREDKVDFETSGRSTTVTLR